MSLLGLMKKFPVNRALTARDRELRLAQCRRLEKEPRPKVGVIKVGSTCLEVVDKFFVEKGFVTLCASIFVGLSVYAVVAFTVLGYRVKDTVYAEAQGELIALLALVYALSLFIASINIWAIFQESLRYTHYPIRLNRLNRMVYVHRIDGTILRIPWDEVYFTLVQEPMFPSGMGANWAIHGHVLDADSETVLETFAFSEVEIPEIVVAHWEFLRRYMEEGPEAVVGYIKYYVPVSTCARRESLREGLRHLRMRYGQFAGVALIYFPFDLASACARWVAMRTGKIPVWPEDVEAACAVADDDPWVRDARNNPARYR